MRGDRPAYLSAFFITSMFTPHARGSTYTGLCWGGGHRVYPACAGIDPLRQVIPACGSSLPRMRGDRPLLRLNIVPYVPFTPHARGSTFPLVVIFDSFVVYPACAGIDPIRTANGG